MIAKSLNMSCGCTDTENQGNKKEKVSGVEAQQIKILLISFVNVLGFGKGEFAFL